MPTKSIPTDHFATLDALENSNEETESSQDSLIMSPNQTYHLDKRSWGRAKPFTNDLEYIEMELEWIKARCSWFDYNSRRSNAPSSRRRWADDSEDLSPIRLKEIVKDKKSEETKLRRQINRRLQAHRFSEHKTLRLDELCQKCDLNDFHRSILLLAIAPCFSKQFNDYFEHVGDR